MRGPSRTRRLTEGSLNGELAGGMVMSLVVGRSGIVVAVTSNIAHASTPSLALRVGDAFEEHNVTWNFVE